MDLVSSQNLSLKKIQMSRAIIEAAWDDRALLQEEETQQAIRSVIDQLDQGILRVAEPTDNGWQVNEWVKKSRGALLPHSKNGNH